MDPNEIVYSNYDSLALSELVEAASRAQAQGKSFRILTGQTHYPETAPPRAWVKFKAGEGVWSPPFYSDVDPYRS